ncbi:hypothetical protein GCM10022281_08560 [Sphingomonas rosea]|uniref:Ankyrin repeat domain-containing protein n=1 Tax=Sphingomonas rosea TaxID=335605 RepID=A0ABP7TUR1_9SPHN
MVRRIFLIAAATIGMVATPLAAQMSESPSLKFLKAIRERDGNTATELVTAQGKAVLNARDDRGDGAIHIVAARRDAQYLRFLAGNGADVDLPNFKGDTALIIAARLGFDDGVETLLRAGAQVDKTNRAGETPLIVAVQQRQMATIKLLAEHGANPDKTDNATGRSARDYAKRDARGPEMIKLMDAARTARPKAEVAGPKF